MPNIDERVVKMVFNNDAFEQGVATTLATLDKLKSALHLDEAANALSGIGDKIAGNFDFSPIVNSLTSTEGRFAQFRDYVTGVFSDLGSRVLDFGLNTGQNLFNKATFEAAIDGFKEYETQMGSIQTIMANTGRDFHDQKAIDQVNTALGELNTYADKTIYNFSEMTRNIGTFTAAGITMEDAVPAIKGIANLAAISGSNSQQASTAMYQLSQALSTGALKLQDWNSVVNAGMGGKVFQDALKRTAEHMGTDVDYLIEKNGSFRESLKEGWITSDVLTETLRQLSISYQDVGDDAYNAAKAQLESAGYAPEEAEQILKLAKAAEESATEVRTWSQLWDTVGEALGSGWTQTWQTIVGDFQEATQLFTWASKSIGGVIDAVSTARNNLLLSWKKEGGRDSLVAAIKSFAEAIYRPINAIATAFSNVFSISGKTLANLTAGLANFAKSLVISDETAKLIQSTFTGLFVILKGFLSIITFAAKLIFNFAGVVMAALKPIIHLALTVTGTIGDALKGLMDLIGLATSDTKAFTDLVTGKIQEGLDKLKSLFDTVKSAVTGFIDTFKDTKTFSVLNDAIQEFLANHPQIKAFTDTVTNNVSTFVEDLKSYFGLATNVLSDTATEAKMKVRLLKDAFNMRAGKYIDQINQFKDGIVSQFKGIYDYFANLTPTQLYNDLMNNFYKPIASFLNFFDNKTMYNAWSQGFMKLYPTLHELLFESENFDEVFAKITQHIIDNLKKLPDNITNLADQIKGSFKYWVDHIFDEVGKIDPSNIVSNIRAVAMFIKASIEAIAYWLRDLPDMIGDYFVKAGDAITAFVNGFPVDKLIGLSEAFKFIAQGASFIMIGKAIKQFAKDAGGALKDIASVPKSIGDGLKSFAEGLHPIKKESKADAFVKIALGITALAGALFVIASLPAEDILKAVKAIGALTIIATVASVLIGALGKFKLIDADSLSSFGEAVKGLGIGVAALVAAAIVLSLFDTDMLMKGVGAVVALAAGLSLMALAIGKNGGSMIKGGIAMGLFAIGLTMLLPLIYALSNIETTALYSAVGAIAALMIALGLLGRIGGQGISKILTGLAAFGAGFLAFTVGLIMLASGLATVAAVLSQLDPALAFATLVTIAGAMITFAFASKIAAKSNPLKLGAGILVFAAAMVVLAVALGAMALIPFDRFIAGMLALAVALGGFAAMTYYLKADDMVATASAIMKFALATLVLGGALAVIGALASLAGNGLLVVAIALAGLSAMAYALDAGKLQATSVSILIFAAAMGVLAAALFVFSAVPVGGIVAGLVSMAVALGLFTLVALAAEALSVGFIVLGASVLMFGLGVLSAAAGVAIFANTLMTLISFGGPLGDFATKIVTAFTAVVDGIGGVIGWITDKVSGLWDFITGNGDAKAAGQKTVAQYAEGARAAEPILDQQINSTKQKVATGLDDADHLGDIGNTNGTAYVQGVTNGTAPLEGTTQELMNRLQGNLMRPDLMNTAGLTDMLGLNGGMLNGLPTITGTADGANSQLIAAFTNPDGYAGAINTDMFAANGELLGWQSVLPATADGISGLTADSFADPEAYLASMGVSMDALNSGLQIGGDQAVAASSDVSNAVKDELSSAGNVDVQSPTQTLADSITSGAGAAIDAASSVADQVKAAFSSIDVSAEGQAAIQGFTSGEESGRGPAVSTAEDIATQAKNSMRKDATDEGAYTSNTYGSGIESGGGRAISAASNIASSTKRNLEFNAYDAGYNSIMGMVSGMDAAAGSVYAKAATIATNAANKIKSALDINSPSKVTMKSGVGIVEGLIVGMEKLEGSLDRASVDTANLMTDSISNTLRAMNVDLNDQVDTEITPKITPVLSSGTLDQDVNTLNGLLAGTGGVVASDPFGLNALNSFTTGSFVNSIGQLRDSNYILDQDIKNLTMAINNMKPSTIMDARGMVVNDPNVMASIANDVVDIFIRKGLM